MPVPAGDGQNLERDHRISRRAPAAEKQHKGIPSTPESKMASSETQFKFLCEKTNNRKKKQYEKLLQVWW